METHGEPLPFMNLKSHGISSVRFRITDEGNFCQNLWRLYVFFFCICFRSLLINTRLVFISCFVSVPLRKGHRGLEYHCLFVRFYLFVFAFLIICI